MSEFTSSSMCNTAAKFGLAFGLGISALTGSLSTAHAEGETTCVTVVDQNPGFPTIPVTETGDSIYAPGLCDAPTSTISSIDGSATESTVSVGTMVQDTTDYPLPTDNATTSSLKTEGPAREPSDDQSNGRTPTTHDIRTLPATGNDEAGNTIFIAFASVAAVLLINSSAKKRRR